MHRGAARGPQACPGALQRRPRRGRLPAQRTVRAAQNADAAVGGLHFATSRLPLLRKRLIQRRCGRSGPFHSDRFPTQYVPVRLQQVLDGSHVGNRPSNQLPSGMRPEWRRPAPNCGAPPRTPRSKNLHVRSVTIPATVGSEKADSHAELGIATSKGVGGESEVLRDCQGSHSLQESSPHIAPRAAMIAEDFCRVRTTLASRSPSGSIATSMVERACARTRQKDRRGRGRGHCRRGLYPEQHRIIWMIPSKNKQHSALQQAAWCNMRARSLESRLACPRSVRGLARPRKHARRSVETPRCWWW